MLGTFLCGVYVPPPDQGSRPPLRSLQIRKRGPRKPNFGLNFSKAETLVNG